jgi:hypothetical protein
MFRFMAAGAILLGATVSAISVPTVAGASPPPPNADDSKIECKYVVASTPGAKPYRMCMNKGDWAIKEAQDNKDANRIVCHYQETPGSRVRGEKICQPASAWAEDRRQSREQTEDIQMRVCVPGAGC